MAIIIEVFFNSTQLKTLLDNDPEGVTVSVIYNNETKKLDITARGIDEDQNKVGNPVNGCPSPCHPVDGDDDCLQKSIDAWGNYIGENWI